MYLVQPVDYRFITFHSIFQQAPPVLSANVYPPALMPGRSNVRNSNANKQKVREGFEKRNSFGDGRFEKHFVTLE